MWLRNRTINTVWFAPRTIGTAGNAIVDSAKTAIYSVLNLWQWLWKTCNDIQTAISIACKEKSRRKKTIKVPTSLIATPFIAIEWIAETLRWTWINGISNIKNTIWNILVNEWNAFKYIWKDENYSSYKFQTIEDKWLSPKNRLAKKCEERFKPTT